VFFCECVYGLEILSQHSARKLHEKPICCCAQVVRDSIPVPSQSSPLHASTTCSYVMPGLCHSIYVVKLANSSPRGRKHQVGWLKGIIKPSPTLSIKNILFAGKLGWMKLTSSSYSSVVGLFCTVGGDLASAFAAAFQYSCAYGEEAYVYISYQSKVRSLAVSLNHCSCVTGRYWYTGRY